MNKLLLTTLLATAFLSTSAQAIDLNATTKGVTEVHRLEGTEGLELKGTFTNVIFGNDRLIIPFHITADAQGTFMWLQTEQVNTDAMEGVRFDEAGTEIVKAVVGFQTNGGVNSVVLQAPNLLLGNQMYTTSSAFGGSVNHPKYGDSYKFAIKTITPVYNLCTYHPDKSSTINIALGCPNVVAPVKRD